MIIPGSVEAPAVLATNPRNTVKEAQVKSEPEVSYFIYWLLFMGEVHGFKVMKYRSFICKGHSKYRTIASIVWFNMFKNSSLAEKYILLSLSQSSHI